MYYFLDFDVPAYKPNHAAPAPTTIDTSPDCSKVGFGSAINHMVTLYNRYMYTDKNNLGNILH